MRQHEEDGHDAERPASLEARDLYRIGDDGAVGPGSDLRLRLR